MAHVGLLHAHQHDAEHALGRREGNQADALSRDLHDARVIGDFRAFAQRQVRRAALGGLLHGGAEVVQHSVDKHRDFALERHRIPIIRRRSACAGLR